MESHHDDDETKGSVYFFVRDYIEAREASGSVRTAGPKDLTVTPTAAPEVAAWLSPLLFVFPTAAPEVAAWLSPLHLHVPRR